MNLSEYLRELKNSDIDTIRSELISRGIQVSYEPTIKSTGSGRFVISTRRYKKIANFNDKLTQQCGGVVVDYQTSKILAFPPKPSNPRYKFNKTVDLVKYNVYQINDGTTVTLYHYDDKWQVSSLNGYSVGALIWAGTKTFKQVLTECLATCPDFNWERLDTNKCYTVGFRHPEYHPFKPSKKVWFIQSVDLSSQNVEEFVPNYEDDIGIPLQPKMNITIEELIDNIRNAGFNYIRDGTIDMGYILRPIENDNSSILLESSLLKYIKKFIYNDRSGRLNPRDENYVGAEKRIIYIALKAYLDVNDHYVFKSLFSQHDDLYVLFSEFIEHLMDALLGQENDYSEYAQNVMRPYLIKEHKLKPRPDMRRGILKDFLIEGVFLNDYFNLMENQF